LLFSGVLWRDAGEHDGGEGSVNPVLAAKSTIQKKK